MTFIGLIVLGAIEDSHLTAGNPYRLTNAMDYNGRICGYHSEVKSKKYGYYLPDLTGSVVHSTSFAVPLHSPQPCHSCSLLRAPMKFSLVIVVVAVFGWNSCVRELLSVIERLLQLPLPLQPPIHGG